MRHPALGRNPGRVEEQGRRPWVFGTVLLFFGRFGQQLVYFFFEQRERLGGHDLSDQLDPVAVTDPEQQGRRAGNSELLAFGDAALDRSRVFAALRAFLEGFSLIPTVFACSEAFPARAPYQGAAAHAELVEDILEMFLDGVFHDTELLGYFFVGESLAQKADNLLFPFGEHVHASSGDLIAFRLCIAMAGSLQ